VDAPVVEVLSCPSCGADVPLGQGDDTRCVHCGTLVPLPAAYRELRRFQTEDEAGRRRAQDLFSRLDSPPFLLTRILAAVFDQPMVVFWLFFGVPVGLESIFVGLAVDARYHPPYPVTIGACFVTLFVLAFVPRSLGIYANRRAGGRRMLLAGLAAEPPKLPGGPARCRQCGAPLDVPPGATVVRCAYCRADSAVRILTPFLESARQSARGILRTIDDATALDRRERSETRRALARELGRYVLVTSTFGGLFAVFAWDDERATLRDDGSAPALGIVALVIAAILLVASMLRSVGGSDARHAEEARQRREGNGVPGWVRVAGPIGVLGVLWVIRSVVLR
jgi:LSD1 subclass zinc finger protein